MQMKWVRILPSFQLIARLGYARARLKFISGKYKGAAFAVPDGGELIIGRSGERDIVLEEEMVSRQHAKVRAEGEELILVDLGSTNGTFVNGEKVRRIALNSGDRLLIGTSIARIVPSNELGGDHFADNTDTLRNLMQDISQKNLTNTAMKGNLDDLPLPDLVQLFMNNMRSGDLRIYSDGKEGHVFFHDGRASSLQSRESFISPSQSLLSNCWMDDRKFRNVSAPRRPRIHGVDRGVYGVIAGRCSTTWRRGSKTSARPAKLPGNVDHSSTAAG